MSTRLFSSISIVRRRCLPPLYHSNDVSAYQHQTHWFVEVQDLNHCDMPTVSHSSLSGYLLFYLSARLSFFLDVSVLTTCLSMSVSLSNRFCLYRSVCLTVSLPVYLSLSPTVCLCLSVDLFVILSACVFVRKYIRIHPHAQHILI